MEDFIKPINEILNDAGLKNLIELMQKNSKEMEEKYNRLMAIEKENYDKIINEKYKLKEELKTRTKGNYQLLFPTKNKLIVGETRTGKSSLLYYWINQHEIATLEKKDIRSLSPYMISELNLLEKFKPLNFNLLEFYKNEIENRYYIFLDDFFQKSNWKWYDNEVSKNQKNHLFNFIDLLSEKRKNHIIVLISNINYTDEFINDVRTFERLNELFKDK